MRVAMCWGDGSFHANLCRLAQISDDIIYVPFKADEPGIKLIEQEWRVGDRIGLRRGPSVSTFRIAFINNGRCLLQRADGCIPETFYNLSDLKETYTLLDEQKDSNQ